jgi:chemotaxis protein histidine kinase CheA
MSELTGISDEFIKLATQEINEELSDISKILGSCQDDEDISKNSIKIEKHMHNIKGLAPMMGKENIGNVAKHLDSILKKIMSGKKVDGIFEPLCRSIEQMKMNMDKHHEMKEIQRQVSKIALKLVD